MTGGDGSTFLAWDTVLPMAFLPGAVVSDERLVAHRVATNLRVLQTCEALEERRAEREEDQSGAPESARLERKIDLLIEMVGHWVSRSAGRPAVAVVRLSPAGISWAAGSSAPGVGAVGAVELFPREGLAEAVQLPGRVMAVDPAGRVSFVFVGLAEIETDALERLIFRQHRRAVASRRRGL